MDKDVPAAISVAGHQIRCVGGKSDESTVGRNVPRETAGSTLARIAGETHALSTTRLAIPDEGIGEAVRISGNDIRRLGTKGDEAAIVAYIATSANGGRAVVISLRAVIR